jgi:chromodomain-helicase-DNA-binding protein 1
MNMDSTTSSSLPNGHLSQIPNRTVTNEDAPYDSESDLSEIREPPAVDTSPSGSSSPQQQSEFGHQDLESSDSSGPENNDGSDDADFDMEESPAAAPDHSARVDRSTSHDSRRPTKRKLGFEDDEYIMANPELYGLRRSVCVISSGEIALLTRDCQARPVQHRTIVS